MKNELSGKIMAKLFALRAKTHSLLIDDCSKDKKQKAQKSVIKIKRKSGNCKTV